MQRDKRLQEIKGTSDIKFEAIVDKNHITDTRQGSQEEDE